jgi:hypothetical protein
VFLQQGAESHTDELVPRGSSRQQAGKPAAAPDTAMILRQLQKRLLNSGSVAPNQLVEGYVFFPVGAYVKGRISLTDQESEEAEGFVVEF